jgi:hypothetical protein
VGGRVSGVVRRHEKIAGRKIASAASRAPAIAMSVLRTPWVTIEQHVTHFKPLPEPIMRALKE